jgi:hypothetical protein
MSKVSLIFDAKKDESVKFSWSHYAEHPEMKKYLKNVKNKHGCYDLIDERTGNIVMSGSMSLQKFLKNNKCY